MRFGSPSSLVAASSRSGAPAFQRAARYPHAKRWGLRWVTFVAVERYRKGLPQLPRERDRNHCAKIL
jgi:hypothetical protein